MTRSLIRLTEPLVAFPMETQVPRISGKSRDASLLPAKLGSISRLSTRFGINARSRGRGSSQGGRTIRCGSIPDTRRRTLPRIATTVLGLFFAVGPALFGLASEDGVADPKVLGKIVAGRQVVPINSRVVIHRAMVQVRAIVLPGLTGPIPPAPGDWTRPQVRKLDIPADEQFLFRVKRIINDRVQVVSQDGQISGWLKRDQVVPLEQAEEHFSRAIEKN